MNSGIFKVYFTCNLLRDLTEWMCICFVALWLSIVNVYVCCGICRKDEASVKGLHTLARRLLTTDNGSEEDGQVLSKNVKPGFDRSRSRRDGTDNSGLSPVASFLLHRFVSIHVRIQAYCKATSDLLCDMSLIVICSNKWLSNGRHLKFHHVA